MRTQKALLALSDFLRELDSEIPISQLMNEILPAIHPNYRNALVNAYRPATARGWFQFFANSVADAVAEQLTFVSRYFKSN